MKNIRKTKFISYLSALLIGSILIFAQDSKAQEIKETKILKSKEPFILRLNKNFDLVPFEAASKFEIGLSNNLYLQMLDTSGKPLYGLTLGIPQIGKYQSPYALSSTIALIDLPGKDLAKALPKEVKAEILKQLGKDESEDLSDILTNLDTTYLLSINGPVIGLRPTDNRLIRNLMYHTWVGQWHQEPNSAIIKYFSQPISITISDPINLEPKDMQINKFVDLSVHYHGPGEMFSPNNMIINIKPNSNFSSFWAIAISKDKKHLIANRFLLANNDVAEEALSNALNNAINLDTLMDELEEFNDSLDSTNILNASEDDKEAISSWLTSLISSLI